MKNENNMKIDYNKFDKLSIYVKKEKRDEIVSFYSLLKWELVLETSNFIYDDTLDLTFIRLHCIKNKDELQLLQVYLEDKINNIVKLEKNKFLHCTTLGFLLGSLSVFLMSIALICYINLNQKVGAILGGVLGILGVSIVILLLVLLPKIIKKDKHNFKTKKDDLNKQIQQICEKIKLLTQEDLCES